MADAILVSCIKLPSGKVIPDCPRRTDDQICRVVHGGNPRSKPELAVWCPAMIEDPLLFLPKRVCFAHRFDGGRIDAYATQGPNIRPEMQNHRAVAEVDAERIHVH